MPEKPGGSRLTSFLVSFSSFSPLLVILHPFCALFCLWSFSNWRLPVTFLLLLFDWVLEEYILLFDGFMSYFSLSSTRSPLSSTYPRHICCTPWNSQVNTTPRTKYGVQSRQYIEAFLVPWPRVRQCSYYTIAHDVPFVSNGGSEYYNIQYTTLSTYIINHGMIEPSGSVSRITPAVFAFLLRI